MENTALLVIDVQKGLADPSFGERSNPGFEANLQALLSHARLTDWHVVIVQHHSIEPGSLLRPELPGCDLEDFVKPQPSETHIVKHTNSAFVGTDLAAILRQRQIGHLLISGLTTEHCVSTTARHGSDLGFRVSLVADAVANHAKIDQHGQIISAEEVHRVSLACLKDEFAALVTANDLIEQD